MSIITAGMLISFSGMIVVAAAILGVLPKEPAIMHYTFIGIGWVFILIGIGIRIWGIKLERKYKK